MVYLISLCTVYFFMMGLYFFNSIRSGVFFLFFVVIYLLVPAKPVVLCSVHSSITCTLLPFLAIVNLYFRWLNAYTWGPKLFYNTVETIFVDGTDCFRRKLYRYPFIFFCQKKSLRLEIGQKPTFGFDIWMRYLISCDRALSRNLTYSSHKLNF